jgi:peptidoglycan hydrolase-like protein with peptidoglycan-binding domain/DNA invertase Pin-like site-specific DNA recombinase
MFELRGDSAVTGSSFARYALQTALALVALLLTHPAAAAQDPRADGARPTPLKNGHGQQVEPPSARLSHARLAGDGAIGGSHARPVGFGAGFDRDCGSDRVREIQRRLRGLGYRLGPVDGLFGPRTRNAVRLLQYTLGVRPTGVVSPTTLALLRERSPLRARAVHVGTGRAGTCGSARVSTVQRRLRTLGYRPGPVDGWFGSRTRDAVVRFQRDHGLEADGSIAPATILAALRPESSERRGERQRVRQPAAPPAGERAASDPRAPVQALADRDKLPAMLTGAAVALLGLNALLLLLARRRPARDAYGQPAAAHPEPDPAVETSREVRGEGPRHRADAPGNALVAGTPVFGYVSVREHERHVDPGAYDAQANEIRVYCNARGLKLIRIVQDVERENGRAIARPGLRYVLEQVALGAAFGLVVTELRRLSGSAAGLAPLLQWFEEWEAALVALDLDLDTTTTAGDHTARALAKMSEWERDRLSERTRRGLEEARAQGRTGHRPSVNDLPELRERIQTLRAQGMTLQAIADVLNREGVPTIRGGKQWRPSSVQTAVGYRRPIGGTRPTGLPLHARFATRPAREPRT